MASMVGFYCVYNGAEGLRRAAETAHTAACDTARALAALGYKLTNQHFFDTLDVGGRSGRHPVARPRTGHQLLLPLRGARAPLVRRGDHPRRGGRGRGPLRRGAGTQTQSRQEPRPEHAARSAAPHLADPHRGGLPLAPQRKRADALHQAAGTPRHLAGRLDDLAGVVHDETQRGGTHATPVVGRVPEHAPLRTRRTGRRLHGADRRARTRPGHDHRTGRLLAATQFGRRGRIRRVDGHPRLPPVQGAGVPQRHPDPRLGARHEPRVGRHGRHEDRARWRATPRATSTSTTSKPRPKNTPRSCAG